MISKTEIEGLKLCSLYAFTPNKLNYCGAKNSFEILKEFIEKPSKENALKAKNALETFCALNEFLELIAECNERKKFDLNVVKAYWLGNELLEKISNEKLKETLALIWQKAKKEEMIKKINEVPLNLKAHHSILLFSGFMNKNLKEELKNKSNCIISWGKVIERKKEKIKVKGIELIKLNNEIALKEKTIEVLNPFNLKAQKNDFISIHWKNAIQIIEKNELKELKKYTLNNLNAIKKINSPQNKFS